MSSASLPADSFVRPVATVLLAAAVALSGCATGKRLTIEPGAVFLLADGTGEGFTPRSGRHDEPVPTAAEGVSAVVVKDERPRPLGQRQSEPLFVRLGGDEVAPDPAAAVQAELHRLANGFSKDSEVAKELLRHQIAVLDCDISFTAADVTQPRPGAAPLSVSQPIAVEATGAGARLVGQALLGGSDIEIRLLVSIDGARFTGVGRGRYTARPGSSATVWPFRRAVASVLAQAGLTSPAEAK
jgi:hypothetical protein